MTTTDASAWRLETLHERLGAERKALGHSQKAFAELMGISRLTQLFYENARVPPPLAYLKAAGEQGVDVEYVLTGKRSKLPPLDE